jgi:D-alanyl-lipoteichoic acid acyltransferase DltB (MBOAT superfamily)
MNFISLQFVIFFLIVLPLNWLLRDKGKIYEIFLLIASYYFYANQSIGFLLVLVNFSFFTWLLPLVGSKYNSKITKNFLFVLHLCIGISVLAFFKYWDMFYLSLDYLFARVHAENVLPWLNIFLPIGISFFTFQGLSYAIDVYRNPKSLVVRPLDVLVFVAFFPTILSGPILRANQFIPQIRSAELSKESYVHGYFLILSGIFKKLFISSYLSEHIVQMVFEMPETYSSLGVLIGVFAYSVQILFDFSGYTDIAMGLALLLGFHIPENFNHPYSSLNLQDFWRRWHISFSNWLRIYLYISLGGNRKGKVRTYINLMVTMILGGIWHGAGLQFITWGTLHGLGLVVTHLSRDIKFLTSKRKLNIPFHTLSNLLSTGLAWGGTFLFVSFAWIFFRSENSDKALDIIYRIISLDMNGMEAGNFVTCLVFLVILFDVFRINVRKFYVEKMKNVPLVVHGLFLGIVSSFVIRFGPDGVPQFIYFQF